MPGHRAPPGFALIEVLVALSVLGVVLLGASLLMLAALRASAAATTRALASSLALDLVERMRSNRASASLYAAEFEADPVSTEPLPCATGVTCESAERATTDIAEWREALRALPAGASARVTPALDADGAWQGVVIELHWAEPGVPGAQTFQLAITDAP